MGLLIVDGIEGYGPDGTKAADDATLCRRVNMRWHRVDGDYGGSSNCSQILGSSTARNGQLCWDFYEGNGHEWLTWLQGGEVTDLVMGFAWRPASDQYGDILYFRHDAGNNLRLGYDINGRLYVSDASNSVVGISTDPLIQFRHWNYIEIKVSFSNTAGTAIVHFNGKEVINVSGQDFEAVGSHPHANNFAFYYRDSVQIDDLYVIDQNTSGLSDFLGPVVIRRLKPNADTATADFTPSDGVDHYACVDDDRVDEVEYLESSTVSDDELWDYESVPSEIFSIVAVNVETAIAATGAGAKKAASLCKSGVTAVQELTQLVTIDNIWDAFNSLVEDDPDTSSPWTISGLNAAQFGVRHKA